MSQIPYCDSNGVISVTVFLQNATNVFLVNQQNLNAYQNGQSFESFGGFYDRSPVHITVRGIGRWFLIVENSQYEYRWEIR